MNITLAANENDDPATGTIYPNPRTPYERRGEPGVWAVEDFGPDGDCHMATFYGPEAESRAQEYAKFKFGV